jgi:hypothetical protein
MHFLGEHMQIFCSRDEWSYKSEMLQFKWKLLKVMVVSNSDHDLCALVPYVTIIICEILRSHSGEYVD